MAKITVGGLIALLRELPTNHRVILSADSEGNGFSPLDGYGVEHWINDKGVIDSEAGRPNCVVLWPAD